jgi:hypothetical protein
MGAGVGVGAGVDAGVGVMLLQSCNLILNFGEQ